MPRSHRLQIQTSIGDCGHIVEMWPLITRIGRSNTGEVICDTCTREKYGIDGAEELTVWVRVDLKDETKPKPKRAPRKKVEKEPKPNPWLQLTIED